MNAVRNTPGKPVWQRNYYEHVIRNEMDLNRIRKYAENVNGIGIRYENTVC